MSAVSFPAPCPHAVAGLLADYLADGLDPAQAAAVEAHVETCPACEAALQRLVDAAGPPDQGPAIDAYLRAAADRLGAGAPGAVRPAQGRVVPVHLSKPDWVMTASGEPAGEVLLAAPVPGGGELRCTRSLRPGMVSVHWRDWPGPRPAAFRVGTTDYPLDRFGACEVPEDRLRQARADREPCAIVDWH
jgi:anti-sigma factor RsiW